MKNLRLCVKPARLKFRKSVNKAKLVELLEAVNEAEEEILPPVNTAATVK